MLRATKRVFEGKEFFCLNDQSAPDMDVAAVEKRVCNQIVTAHCKFNCTLDAFAGVGISAFLWARCSRRLILVERRKRAVILLRKNLRNLQGVPCDVRVVCGAAQDFLKDAAEARLTFDLVDLDPFGDCVSLLPTVAQLVRRGVVCITTGEIYRKRSGETVLTPKCPLKN